MTKEDFKKIKISPEEFFERSKPDYTFKKVTEEIRKEAEKRLVDPIYAKRCKAWNEVANKVVGYE